MPPNPKDPARLFVPGFAVRGNLYRPGLPPGWVALDPPSMSVTGGRFDAYRRWLYGEVEARGRPLVLAGHSMGAALAICAASELPELVERLILFSPAGVPLSNPMFDSFLLLVRQSLQGLYSLEEIAFVVRETVKHPWATYRLARQAHDLDLSAEIGKVAAASIPTLVVGCESDTLTTTATCAHIADRLAGRYGQITGRGHMWMLTDWRSFGKLLNEEESEHASALGRNRVEP